VADLLDAVGLSSHRNRPFSKLSGGQKQRLSIALALIGTPDIVVLDELTTGVDPEGRREVWRLVEGFKEQGTTFILVSHDLDEIDRLCDRFAIIADGRTRFVGTSDDLMRRYPPPSPSRWALEDSYVAFLSDARQKEGTIQ
ncbi:ATP-binding cassette domain-containing protein, partial [Microbacterium sp.]|uniref:ATP-binding cassette domain-containing protein n=1 Tax=Microbacterium sp. TaxID=51671 RepID=UPI0027327E83